MSTLTLALHSPRPQFSGFLARSLSLLSAFSSVIYNHFFRWHFLVIFSCGRDPRVFSQMEISSIVSISITTWLRPGLKGRVVVAPLQSNAACVVNVRIPPLSSPVHDFWLYYFSYYSPSLHNFGYVTNGICTRRTRMRRGTQYQKLHCLYLV